MEWTARKSSATNLPGDSSEDEKESRIDPDAGVFGVESSEPGDVEAVMQFSVVGVGDNVGGRCDRRRDAAAVARRRRLQLAGEDVAAFQCFVGGRERNGDPLSTQVSK